MNAVDKFNALNGAVVSRQEIKKILELANDQEQLFIAKRLKRLLESNPDDKEFELSLSERAIEVVPKSLLHCLDYEPENDDTDSQGLGRITPSDIYQMITDKMIQAIKEASGKEYKKKWKDGYLTDEKGEPVSGYLFPFNFITKKPYRGINILLLSQRNGLQILPMKNPFFMTFKQIESLGARLKKGAKGYPVVYFTILYKIKTDKLDFATYDKDKFIEYLLKNGYDQKEIGSIISNNHIPILRYYNVFNGEDIEGVDFDLDNFKIGKILPEIKGEKQERLEIAEQIIAHYPKPQPKIKEGNSDEAYYSPRTDLVRMPHFDSFDTAQDYYRTLFHELIHSTGHQSRLNRDFTGSFGSKKYAKEELVAEFGAVFLSAQAGIIWYSDKNHAEYIKNWHSVLGIIEEDNRFLMRAASEAQRATDFILQLDSEGVPLYQKQLEEKIKTESKKENQKSSDSEGVATSKKTRGTKGDKKSNSTFKNWSKTEPVQVVRYFDRYAGLPFGQKGDIQTHGIPSTETGRMLRFGAELSDGSIVSLDGVVRRTKPEVWEAHKNYIASKKGANKNQAIIEKTMSYDEFKQYLDSLYETTLRNGSLVHRLSELKFYKNEFKGSLIDGLVNVDINIDGKKINPRSYFEAKHLEIEGNTKQKKNLTIADKVKEAESELKAMTTTQELREWAVTNGMDNRSAFPKFKNALKEIGIDYDGIKRQSETAKKEQKEADANYEISLYSDYKLSTNKFAITDENGKPLWYGVDFDNPTAQTEGELNAAKKAIWLAQKIAELKGEKGVKLNLYVDAQWLVFQSSSKQKGYELKRLADRYNVSLNTTWIPGKDNPADEYTTASDYLKWSDNSSEDLFALLETKTGLSMPCNGMSKKEISEAAQESTDRIRKMNDWDFAYTMPDEAIREIKSWEIISKSPYSHSYYNDMCKSWTHTTEGSLRIADHWNFKSRGENRVHCPTDKPITQGHWILGQWVKANPKAKPLTGYYNPYLYLTDRKTKAKILEYIEDGYVKCEFLEDGPINNKGEISILPLKDFTDKDGKPIDHTKLPKYHYKVVKDFGVASVKEIKERDKKEKDYFEWSLFVSGIQEQKEYEELYRKALKLGINIQDYKFETKKGKAEYFDDVIKKFIKKVKPIVIVEKGVYTGSGSRTKRIGSTHHEGVLIGMTREFATIEGNITGRDFEFKNKKQGKLLTDLLAKGSDIYYLFKKLNVQNAKKALAAPNTEEIEPINTSETSVNIESGLSNPTSKPKNPLVIPMVEEPPKDVKFFNIKGDFGKFLGNVEVKPIHSVAVTLDAPQGAGKTRFFYYIMNLFAEQGYRCLFVSLEEHPLSELAQQKKRQYISSKNFKLIDTVAELPNGYKDLEKLIPDYDVIFIDSWGKVTEIHRIDFDKSLRKKYNGKLFFVIFQRTVAGTMRGGSASQFDGDIIMKIEKSESGDFKENYAFFDKNRYQSIELDKLKFNTYYNKLIKETPKKEKENKEVQPKS